MEMARLTHHIPMAVTIQQNAKDQAVYELQGDTGLLQEQQL